MNKRGQGARTKRDTQHDAIKALALGRRQNEQLQARGEERQSKPKHIGTAYSWAPPKPNSTDTRPRGTNVLSKYGAGIHTSARYPLSTRTMIKAAEKRNKAATKHTTPTDIQVTIKALPRYPPTQHTNRQCGPKPRATPQHHNTQNGKATYQNHITRRNTPPHDTTQNTRTQHHTNQRNTPHHNTTQHNST